MRVVPLQIMKDDWNHVRILSHHVVSGLQIVVVSGNDVGIFFTNFLNVPLKNLVCFLFTDFFFVSSVCSELGPFYIWTLCGKRARGDLKFRFIAVAGAQACGSGGRSSVWQRRARKCALAADAQACGGGGRDACGALLTGVMETNINR